MQNNGHKFNFQTQVSVFGLIINLYLDIFIWKFKYFSYHWQWNVSFENSSSLRQQLGCTSIQDQIQLSIHKRQPIARGLLLRDTLQNQIHKLFHQLCMFYLLQTWLHFNHIFTGLYKEFATLYSKAITTEACYRNANFP